MIEITKFSKSDHGTVEVHNVITGNVTTTWYEVNDLDGKEVISGQVDNIAIIGMRGWGNNTRIPDTETIKGETNYYDDMLIVVSARGDVNAFYNVNFEGSTATGYWDTSYIDKQGWTWTIRNYLDRDGKTPRIADGTYTLHNWNHKGLYDCLVLNKNGPVPTIGMNPNYPGRYFADAIEIHKGGERGWNYSAGCITVRASDWDDFISCFPTGPKGREIGTISIVTL